MGRKFSDRLLSRHTIPSELEDPEDCTVGEADADLIEQQHIEQQLQQQQQHSRSSSFDDVLEKIPREARNLVAGGIAGMTAKTVVAPVDRIKILYQVSNAEFRLRRVPAVAANIVHNEGVAALFKGNTATMIRVFPYSGIQFMVFDRCKRYFLQQQSDHEIAATPSAVAANTRKRSGLTAGESLIGGMVAGVVSVCCTYPLDLTRAQMAVLKKIKPGDGHSSAKASAGFWKVMTDNVHRGSTIASTGSGLDSALRWTGLFRGIAPTLIGILPYSGIAFALNEQAKLEIQRVTGRDLKTTERMQCGAFSGLIAQSITYPIEVTRRRMQTLGIVNRQDSAIDNLGGGRNGNGSSAGGSSGNQNGRRLPTSPPSMTTVVRSLYAEQGWRGFFKGVSMNWMKGPIAFSISFTTFDLVQSHIESESERARRFSVRL